LPGSAPSGRPAVCSPVAGLLAGAGAERVEKVHDLRFGGAFGRSDLATSCLGRDKLGERRVITIIEICRIETSALRADDMPREVEHLPLDLQVREAAEVGTRTP